MSSDTTQLVLFVLILTLVLFLTIFLLQRKQRRTKVEPVRPRTSAEKLKRAVIHALRLIGFTILALFVVIVGVEVFISYQTIQEDTANKAEGKPR